MAPLSLKRDCSRIGYMMTPILGFMWSPMDLHMWPVAIIRIIVLGVID